ncbi:phosphate-binding protein [Geomonas silvestris]|uniref:Phosphate-binding protein n=1 Tax=Geomonas silvestris TaxID=2740184 RepID=A0A6V8MEI8_9BACT|nr:substrate-binding domain-containing protein [Geomonas silvestris]GFO58411.1 phosphate-binding protein [Geomonas silvestris]
MKRLIATFALTALCTATFSLVAFAEDVKIGAGAAPSENVLKPIAQPLLKEGISLYVSSSGPKNAMMDLERGVVDAAAAGLTFQDWLNLMKKEGHEVKDPASLQWTMIGKDKIVALVNKENPVAKLSKEQLQGIFSGKVDSWKEVGGADVPVLIVWGKLTSGTNSMFANKIMDGKEVTKEVIETMTAEDIRQNVASNPSAIGIGPLAVLDGTVKQVESPEIGRDIILVTKGKPSAKVQKVLDFIKGEGQKYIKK